MNWFFPRSVRPLVRVLRDMQDHVPGLAYFTSWYLELLVSGRDFALVHSMN